MFTSHDASLAASPGSPAVTETTPGSGRNGQGLRRDLGPGGRVGIFLLELDEHDTVDHEHPPVPGGNTAC